MRTTFGNKVVITTYSYLVITRELAPISADGGVTPGAAYPLSKVRADILWEMQNAKNRLGLAKAWAIRDYVPPADASPAELKKLPYKVAASALSVEWNEWINVFEAALRVTKINAVPGMAATQVDDQFGANFAEEGKGWYNFNNYLKEMRGWHTTSYDPAANDKEWKGVNILKVANAVAVASLSVSKAEVTAFKAGRSSTLKKISNNPFASEKVITDAMALK